MEKMQTDENVNGASWPKIRRMAPKKEDCQKYAIPDKLWPSLSGIYAKKGHTIKEPFCYFFVRSLLTDF